MACHSNWPFQLWRPCTIIPSYASETAAWPLQNLRTLRTPRCSFHWLSSCFDAALRVLTTGQGQFLLTLVFGPFKTSLPFGPLASYLCFSSPWLQLLSGLSFQLRTSPCKSQWPFQLFWSLAKNLLTLPRLPPGPFKTSVPFGPLAAASSFHWAFQLLGHWLKLSTRRGCSCLLACHSNWPFQLWRPCTIIPSYASETAAWPLQNLRTLRTPRCSFQLPLSFPAAWPLVEAFDKAWLQLLIGLSFQLAFPAVEAMHNNSFLRFRDCRLAPSKPPYPSDPSLQLPLRFPAASLQLCVAWRKRKKELCGRLQQLWKGHWICKGRSQLECKATKQLQSMGWKSRGRALSKASTSGQAVGKPSGSCSERSEGRGGLEGARRPPKPSLQLPAASPPASGGRSCCLWVASEWPPHPFQFLSLLPPPKTLAAASSGLSSSFQWPLLLTVKPLLLFLNGLFPCLCPCPLRTFKRPSNLGCSSQCLSLLVCAHDFVRFRNYRLPPQNRSSFHGFFDRFSPFSS